MGSEEKDGNAPTVGSSVEVDDLKYVSGLSTILVATIQEAKDRISQIEYIFCSQLYPNFQSKSRSLQAICAEALQSAETTWKEKENSLLLQLGKLGIEKEQLIQENQSHRVRIEELERALGQKIKEIDDGMELQRKLIDVVQSSELSLANRAAQLKEHKEAANALLSRQRTLEKSVEDMREELRQKTEEIVKAKQLEANLLKKMQVQAAEIFGKEQLLLDCDNEKGLLKLQIGRLEEDLQKRTRDNNEEAWKFRKMQLKQHDEERAKLMRLVEALEGKLKDSQALLEQKNCDGDRIIQELQSAKSELSSEKKKTTDLLSMYKDVKSQNNYLLKKLSQFKSQNENPHSNQVTPPCVKNGNGNAAVVALGIKVKDEIEVDEAMENSCDKSLLKSVSPGSGVFVAPKSLPSKRSTPASGTKRPASGWRDTRSHQSRCGPDPHDDFLDTPLENIRGNLNTSRGNELRNPSKHEPEGVNQHVTERVHHNTTTDDDDDDETQDMNIDPHSAKQQAPPLSDGNRKSFKYVAPVRKKADRDALKGVECKQCKKFYDAVLPDNNGNADTDGNKSNHRCEHHEGVSRHRYKYVPPLTPEGFWNIGFESEM